jgi:hypothetical protein
VRIKQIVEIEFVWTALGTRERKKRWDKTSLLRIPKREKEEG